MLATTQPPNGTVLGQAGGGELAAAVTGAFMALADAGVPLTGLVAACAVGKVKGAGQLVLDPSCADGDGPRDLAGAATLALLFTQTGGAGAAAWGEGASTQFLASGSGLGGAADVMDVLDAAVGGCGALRQTVEEALVDCTREAEAAVASEAAAIADAALE